MTDDEGRMHRLVLSVRRCGDHSTCWYGTCTCSAWTKGPHFMQETVQAYWQDHLYLEDPGAYFDLHPGYNQHPGRSTS